MKKQTPLREFREQLAADMGVPAHQQRLWTFAKRQNNTLRYLLGGADAFWGEQADKAIALESPLHVCRLATEGNGEPLQLVLVCAPRFCSRCCSMPLLSSMAA